MPIYNVPCLLQIMDVNGDGTDDLLIGEPTRNANKLEIINDWTKIILWYDDIKLRSLEYGQNQATCIPLYFQKNN
jgi:hypothetical protein